MPKDIVVQRLGLIWGIYANIRVKNSFSAILYIDLDYLWDTFFIRCFIIFLNMVDKILDRIFLDEVYGTSPETTTHHSGTKYTIHILCQLDNEIQFFTTDFVFILETIMTSIHSVKDRQAPRTSTRNLMLWQL